jgi:hypothetical protein
LAYAGLADYYDIAPVYTPTPSSETLPKTRAAAQKALAIDDTLTEAHPTLADTFASVHGGLGDTYSSRGSMTYG